MVDGGEYLGGFAQTAHGHEVAGHEEEQRRGVVAGSEGAGDEAAGAHRGTPALVVHRVERTVAGTQETVAAASLASLLFGKDVQDVPDGLDPFWAEDRRVASHLPVVVGKADGVARRVNLVLAFVQFGMHACVLHPWPIGVRLSVEGIGIRVAVDALPLAQDHPGKHPA